MKFSPLGLVILLAAASAAFSQQPTPAKPAAATPPPLDKRFDSFEAKTVTEDGVTIAYRFHRPAEITPGGKYPVVLFLHGWGERGDDNRAQLKGFGGFPFWENYPCFIIAPQCPRQGPPEQTTWVSTDFRAGQHTMAETPTKPLAIVLSLLEETLKSQPIDPQRVYITGLSMGGFATYELLSRKPELFAAAVPICGGADLAQAPKFAKTPLWIFHGGADPVVKTQRSRELVGKLEELGAPVKYTEYPGVGHDAWTQTYSNPEVWHSLFAKSKR